MSRNVNDEVEGDEIVCLIGNAKPGLNRPTQEELDVARRRTARRKSLNTVKDSENSQPLACEHLSIGICVSCYHERIAAGVKMPDPIADSCPGHVNGPERCICGRWMTLVIESNHNSADVFWCGGCGVLHIHYSDGRKDSRYIPNPELTGKRYK